MKPEEDWIEKAKRRAASEATKNVKDNFIIGLGSGSTVKYAIEEVGKKIKREKLHIRGVPSSYQTLKLAIKQGIPITTLEEHPFLDLTIDGADQIDDELNLIKGRGGAFTREKIIAFASKKLLIVADERKKVKVLGEKNQPVPIEVLPFTVSFIAHKIKEMNGIPVLRESIKKVGPVITDDGNLIIDVNFGHIDNPENLDVKLKQLPGIIETGLFVKMAPIVYLGKQSTVDILEGQVGLKN